MSSEAGTGLMVRRVSNACEVQGEPATKKSSAGKLLQLVAPCPCLADMGVEAC
jgi:hypothetical protein